MMQTHPMTCGLLLAGALMAPVSLQATALQAPASATEATQSQPAAAVAPYSANPAQYVDPMIGSSNFGATHPGAQYPHALLSVSPFNVAFGQHSDAQHGDAQNSDDKGKLNPVDKDASWNSRSYIAENRFLTGFSHVNLSGVGCPEFGVLLAMPTHGELQLDPAQYGSTFSDEIAKAGYYSNLLSRYRIKTEMTSTARSGISRYQFPAGQSHILLNLGLGLSNESGGAARLVSDTEVEGYRLTGTFCYHNAQARPVYFVARLNKKPQTAGLYKKMPTFRGVEADWVKHNGSYKTYPHYRQELAGDDIGAYFSFNTTKDEQIELQLAISFVSIANARQNLQAEQPQFAFEQTRAANEQAWHALLSRIDIDAAPDDKIRFYTALYHALIHPSVISDVNGDYPRFAAPDGQTATFGNDKTAPRYSIYSLWDSHRNVHPLLSLVYPKLQTEMAQSLVAMGKEQGWLPKWELAGIESKVMVGDPATIMLTDTYRRGLTDFDVQSAYALMKKAALTASNNPLRPENADYLKLGYVPLDDEGPYDGSVSTSLEYYLADYNLSLLAAELGQHDDARRFRQQADGYRKLLDLDSGMFRPKWRNGQFLTPFNPDAGQNFEPNQGYIEGTAWNYRFYLPQAIPDLIKTLGAVRFERELDTTFSAGKFDMANEPDISYPFLYNYLDAVKPGSRHKTSARVQQLLQQHFTLGPAGLPGNDDAGTMSAWLVFSMLGLYPTEPGVPNYTLFSPSVKAARIWLDPAFYPGKLLEIKATDSTPATRQPAFNQQPLPAPFISHQQLVQGGLLQP